MPRASSARNELGLYCRPLVLRSSVDHRADEPVTERRRPLGQVVRVFPVNMSGYPQHPGIERFGEFPGSHDSNTGRPFHDQDVAVSGRLPASVRHLVHWIGDGGWGSIIPCLTEQLPVEFVVDVVKGIHDDGRCPLAPYQGRERHR